MEQHALKIINNCLNTNIYSHLETSGGQSSNLYLKVHFFKTSVIRHQWQLKTVAFLHWCLIRCVIFTHSRKAVSSKLQVQYVSHKAYATRVTAHLNFGQHAKCCSFACKLLKITHAAANLACYQCCKLHTTIY